MKTNTDQMTNQMNSLIQQTTTLTGVDLKEEDSPAKPMILNSNNGGSESSANDRLIQSISMIKEILKSNMELREQQMSGTQAQDQIAQENYQLRIENEDLRDRLMLMTQKSGYQIEYQAYLPVLDLDKMI